MELKIKTRKGDLHFINNLAVLHRRDEFVDDDDDDDEGITNGERDVEVGEKKNKKKRHLVRMRIRSQEMGWELPKELQGEWDKVFGEEGERVWHLEPMPEGFFPLRMYPL